MPFTQFRQDLNNALQDGSLWTSVLGEGRMIPGLYDDVALTYADYVASGRALRQIEDFVAEQVLPFYANSHTESSYCGSYITTLRNQARKEIATLVEAGPEDAVIFAGSGATAGINRLVRLFAIDEAQAPVVIIGPYEHHSNILPWRETKAKIIEIQEAPTGGPDMDQLRAALNDHAASDLVIGSFSAASNVTGIITDTDAVTRVLKAHGALAVWDFAGGGPYLPISMSSGDTKKDAIVVSPHKFPGGPGASGILVVNGQAVRLDRPSWPGGGTVTYVSPWEHDYAQSLEAREEAGTPNIIGDIRAALAFVVKDVIGDERIQEREHHYSALAEKAWANTPEITILGGEVANRLPIFSLVIRDQNGQAVSPLLITMMLSDIYGVQVRGGCSCAGPYGHRLLEIDAERAHEMRADIVAGNTREKPGWVRLNFSYMMQEDTAKRIAAAVEELSRTWQTHLPYYTIDARTGQPTRNLHAA